jgi:hypothetical protein
MEKARNLLAVFEVVCKFNAHRNTDLGEFFDFTPALASCYMSCCKGGILTLQQVGTYPDKRK